MCPVSQAELEQLNQASDQINQLELQLDVRTVRVVSTESSGAARADCGCVPPGRPVQLPEGPHRLGPEAQRAGLPVRCLHRESKALL